MSQASVRERLAPYFWVTKPRIVELLLATAVPTLFLASDGLPTLISTIAVVIGGSAAAASANTYNSIYDRDIDAIMHRTGTRPLASGVISVRAGLIQASILGIVSVVTLGLLTNWLAAFLGFLAIVLYAVGYTVLLKRSTPQNIVWGGAAGCMPVLIAWAAVTGTLSWTPAVLFLVVFLWTPAHYWPLAIKYRDDYASVGVPMLPVVAPPKVVTRNVVIYSIAMVLASLLLIPVAPMGWVYAIGAVVLGVWFVAIALSLVKLTHKNSVGYQELQKPAMKVFHGSITYLALLFLLVGITPFVP
ncbi:MAG: heme o synthase [Candidatus Nanopelagicales bacterium]|nr:heme o synthase [Actinomycetes bacterium]